MGDGLTLLAWPADFGLSINMRAERPVTRAGTLDYMAPVRSATQHLKQCCLLILWRAFMYAPCVRHLLLKLSMPMPDSSQHSRFAPFCAHLPVPELPSGA